ncbi:DUF397 domain-containing protein [Sphaerisporangium corydalis]|uniref:DUF397 domain-containing protein n=1 Tax=Sphaerisporangium corydalis TaxID=1441875 RepID=A0ABV9ED72_9ACTN|nr:DUF397 domain-containing protein [Sphaerisporangium corydalis]
MDDLISARWVKSSYSGDNGGECVEVAFLSAGRMGIRDSKWARGPVLWFGAAEWDAFRESVRRGGFGGSAAI